MRSCGTCTRCCEGWLIIPQDQWEEQTGEKKPFRGAYPGKPCFYLGKNCTIYEKRPEVCRKFNCEWILNEEIPEWMKPELSNVIIKKIKNEKYTYFETIETGEPITVPVLNFIFSWALSNRINLKYTVFREPYKVGTPEFCLGPE